jgi:hypothetical protein
LSGPTGPCGREDLCRHVQNIVDDDEDEHDGEEKLEKDKTSPDHFDASEIELDPEALGMVTAADDAHKGVTDEKLKRSDKRNKKPETIGREDSTFVP